MNCHLKKITSIFSSQSQWEIHIHNNNHHHQHHQLTLIFIPLKKNGNHDLRLSFLRASCAAPAGRTPSPPPSAPSAAAPRRARAAPRRPRAPQGPRPAPWPGVRWRSGMKPEKSWKISGLKMFQARKYVKFNRYMYIYIYD